MPGPRTTPGKLSELARHVVVPAGITSTGWPAVRDTCAGFGVTFDPWQDGAGRLILAKRADGTYAASVGGVVMSIPRQVGKTFLIGAIVFALCLLNPGTTVLWTAHRLRTANETFGKMQSFARRKKVAPHISKVVLGSGDEAIEFHNGSRILFGARERGFGRGFDNVDVEVFDEAQILTENAVDDMIPAMNTAANPLAIFIGTPPKPSDPSEVFTAKRAAALSGEDEDTAYVEFSADPGASLDDRRQLGKANPSYPTRTPESAMLRMKKNLTPESFLREGLGVWDEVSTSSVIDLAAWAALCDPGTERPSPVAFGVAVSPDRKWATIGVAGARPDGNTFVGIVQSGRGTAWLLDRLLELDKEWHPVGIAIDRTSPAGSLLPELTARRVRRVVPMSIPEVAQACGLFADGVDAGTLRHDGSRLLEISLSAATWRRTGESRVWAPPADGSTDIAPLQAATIALHALTKKKPARSTSGGRRAVVMT